MTEITSSLYGNEAPKYNFQNAKKDLIAMLAAVEFRTEAVNEAMGRVLDSKIGKMLIIFVTNEEAFKVLDPDIQSRIKPLAKIINTEGVLMPDSNDYPLYLELAKEVLRNL